ncbi:MAG: DUF971 domain-containing protein [Planctomycetaceae bacterium]
MTTPPQTFRAVRSERVLEIAWSDGPQVRMPFRYLRGRCPCATCVDEFTSVRKVDVVDVPEGIEIESAAMAGNYAVKIAWNDRHDTGLFTWEHLRELCDAREWEPVKE